MTKRIITILVLVLSLSLFASAAEISSADDMLTLMNTPSMWADSYTLTTDIDLGDATNGLSQAPIGTETNPFTGNFDGAGYTISGVAITTETDFTAFFGCVENGSIKNLTVVGSVTSTKTYTGVGAYLGDKVVTTISYEGVADDTLVFKGYYTNIKGEVKTVEEKVYIYDGAVRVDLDDIAIKDLLQGVTGALYNADGVQVSKSITTNFEVYATQAISKFDDSKLHAVCRAAFAYSDAARDYFLAQ